MKYRAEALHVLRRVVAPGLIVYLVLVGCGLLITRPLRGIIAGEDDINRSFAEHRTHDWNIATHLMSMASDTTTVVPLLVVLALLLRWIFRRWAEAVTLISAVALQETVFLLVVFVIHRQRPDVPHLDPAPPTSSFPSGHAGAAVALYGTLAVIVGWRMRNGVLKTALLTVLLCLPFLVGASRLYRGMHHPSDVLFGVANGIVWVAIAVHAFLPTTGQARPLQGRVVRPRVPDDDRVDA
ncbi:phosphatase PAP2 family protein [Dactylosporangium vinaceum]|uniref:Phosphatase PAP2 family protein n=1 Tax=Dactylosporangium vinaceum TaxID=53362 RepID=A0ABV5M380_9ACTN|nr:phosphatase PAP2 family protein [Dactylosporangium vinaceum]UAB99768.1 phosphatase PAP2 family protein [Dactylosporangium vinaceum]